MFCFTDTHPGYVSACSIALGLLSESEHLISSSHESSSGSGSGSGDKDCNSIALSYYLKSNLLTSRMEASSSQTPLPISQQTAMSQNAIASMLLGALFLRGGSTTVETSLQLVSPSLSSSVEISSVTKSSEEIQVEKPTDSKSDPNLGSNLQTAFDYYKLAALAHNPIAQHK
jgi:hypothetical protein